MSEMWTAPESGWYQVGGTRPVAATETVIEMASDPNPWIPLDPDGLPPVTYPAWRSAEKAKRTQAG